jgi:hypothetical protein
VVQLDACRLVALRNCVFVPSSCGNSTTTFFLEYAGELCTIILRKKRE